MLLYDYRRKENLFVLCASAMIHISLFDLSSYLSVIQYARSTLLLLFLFVSPSLRRKGNIVGILRYVRMDEVGRESIYVLTKKIGILERRRKKH
jgi:hypothetical protein